MTIRITEIETQTLEHLLELMQKVPFKGDETDNNEMNHILFNIEAAINHYTVQEERYPG